jgi:hypothetical protein
MGGVVVEEGRGGRSGLWGRRGGAVTGGAFVGAEFLEEGDFFCPHREMRLDMGMIITCFGAAPPRTFSFRA